MLAAFYSRVLNTARSQNPSVKVLIALGGWTDSESDKYSRLVADQAAINKFVSKAKAFVRNHNFDGLSLEWQYPVCWQSNCNKGPPSDKQGFSNLVKVRLEITGGKSADFKALFSLMFCPILFG